MTRGEFTTLNVTPWLENDYGTAVMVEPDGINQPVVNHESDTRYMVTEGVAVFAVNGTKHHLSPGESVLVPKNTPYHDMGRAVMLAVSVPPFNPDSVETIGS